MQGDDLAIFGILWGTAIAFALAAVTMVDSGRKKILTALWAVAGGFLLLALFWPWIAEKWPALREWANGLAENRMVLNLTGTAIFSLLFLDFGLRSGWLGKTKRHIRDESAHQAVEALQARFDLLPVAPQQLAAPYDDSDVRNALDEVRQFNANQIVQMHTTEKALGELRDGVSKIAAIERNLIRNNQKLLGNDRDLPATMETLMESLALSILFNAVPPVPAFSDIDDLDRATMKAESEKAIAYRNEVRNVLSNTQWRSEVNAILADANIMGEEDLRNIPEDRRPNIDALDLRHYMIARNACLRLNALINSERSEAASKYISHLERLRQKFWERQQIDRANQ
ncbi:hypothetical protein [Bradyrhizobium sp. USDA 3315]